MQAPSWLLEIKKSIFPWLNSLRNERQHGAFQWCREGSDSNVFLGASALALKIAYQINKLNELKPDELNQSIDFISSFQNAGSGRYAGLFVDKIQLGNRGWRSYFKKSVDTILGETRQACAALIGARAQPRFAIQNIPRTEKEVKKYIDKLPWATNPWAAGSLISNLLFSHFINDKYFGFSEDYERITPIIFERLDLLQDDKTGSWFMENPPVYQKINAAMKVLLSYELTGKPFKFPEKLIDFCLGEEIINNACHDVDILYVVHQCFQWVEYRSNDVREFAKRKLNALEVYKKPDGAFSFYPDKAQIKYYGAPISKGMFESDLHGTHLLVWACTLLSDLLGFKDQLGWKQPIT